MMPNISIGRCVNQAGKTPDELVDHLRALTDRCNFPKDGEKE